MTPIKFTQIRDNQQLGEPQQRSIESALRAAVLGDLAFGGIVTDVTETKLVITTPVLGMRDISVFEGTEDDMLLLTEAAYYWAMLSQRCLEVIRDQAIERVFKKYPEGTLIRPQLLEVESQLTQIFTGTRITKGVMAAMIVDEISAQDAKKLVYADEKDLFDGLILARLQHMPVSEVIQLLN